MTLKPSEGGLGINCLRTESSVQYSCSEKVSTVHVQSIKQQSMQMLQADTDGRSAEHVKAEVRLDKFNSQKHLNEEIFNSLPENVTPYVKQATDRAAAN